MKVPKQFTIVSNTGIFIMTYRKKLLGTSYYYGSANGFTCMSVTAPSGTHRAKLWSEEAFWKKGRVNTRGNVENVDDLKTVLSAWIDKSAWDEIADYKGSPQFIETKNGKIACYMYNQHLDGVPIIFLHGGPGDGAGVSKMRMLQLEHPIMTYDQLGCGNSDPIPNPKEWNHDDYIDELNEIINNLGFKKFILIGASWGAGLAAGYATKYGCDKIKMMILVSPFLSTKIWIKDQIANLKEIGYDYQKLVKSGKMTEENRLKMMTEYYSRYLFTRGCNRSIAMEAAMTEQNDVFKEMWGPNEFECTGTMKNFNLVPNLEKISVPVLLMCGDSDQVRIETMLQYNNSIKDSKLSIIPFAGHALSTEQFNAYAESIRAFMREHDF